MSGCVGKTEAVRGCVGKTEAMSGCVGKTEAVRGCVGKTEAMSGCVGKTEAVAGCVGKTEAMGDESLFGNPDATGTFQTLPPVKLSLSVLILAFDRLSSFCQSHSWSL
jgi:hypothetical protein